MFIREDELGKYYYKDPDCTIFHREDGPAIENANGDKEWRLNGKRHRLNGPAVEYIGGSKEWWLNGVRHRENGPAIDFKNGYKEWCFNGRTHREDGPAVERTRGKNEYWLNGILLPKTKYIQYIQSENICPAKKLKILKRCI